MRKHYSLSLLDCDNMQTHTRTSQKEGLAQKRADKKGNGGECKKQGNNRMKRDGGSSGGLLSSSAHSLWQENYSEVQALDGCLKRNSRESLNETDLLKQTVPYRWNQIAFTGTVGLGRLPSKWPAQSDTVMFLLSLRAKKQFVWLITSLFYSFASSSIAGIFSVSYQVSLGSVFSHVHWQKVLLAWNKSLKEKDVFLYASR